VLCPRKKSLSLSGRQNNCHPKYVAARGWRRNCFGSTKVIKLGLGAVCFSERVCILGSPPVVTQTLEDHATHSNLWEEEMHKDPVTLCIEINVLGSKKEEKKTNRKRRRQGKYTHVNKQQKHQESPACTHSYQCLVGWTEGEDTRSLQVLVLTFLAMHPDFSVFLLVKSPVPTH